jgi:hypothetical protein
VALRGHGVTIRKIRRVIPMKRIYHITLILFTAGAVAICATTSETVAAPDARSNVLRDSRRGVLQVARNVQDNSQLVHRKAGFPGGWHGSLILARATCSGFAPNFLFRHVTSVAGNRVTLRTSHDGTLFGITRDKGRRLEATRRYNKNNVQVTANVVYLNATDTAVDIGLGVELRNARGVCSAIYTGKGVRAF